METQSALALTALDLRGVSEIATRVLLPALGYQLCQMETQSELALAALDLLGVPQMETQSAVALYTGIN
jgi:hypothetical protein